MPDQRVLRDSELRSLLRQVDGWHLVHRSLETATDKHQVISAIEKTWQFADFGQTMAFVNAVAQVAQDMDHHPEMRVSYQRCTLLYTTHDTGCLTHLDLEAAQRVNSLPLPLLQPKAGS